MNFFYRISYGLRSLLYFFLIYRFAFLFLRSYLNKNFLVLKEIKRFVSVQMFESTRRFIQPGILIRKYVKLYKRLTKQ